jgi:bifunctional DNase/RNase
VRASAHFRPPPLFWVASFGSALLGLALACTSGDRESEHDVRVRVERVGLDANDLPVLLLEEDGGSRWLPIWIGSAEAQSIAAQIEALDSPRPNSHDLARSVIDGLRGEVERVVVTDLDAGTYYATLTLRSGSRRVEIDARPSDAVAIALRTGAPIFVRERLFDRVDRPLDAASERATSI